MTEITRNDWLRGGAMTKEMGGPGTGMGSEKEGRIVHQQGIDEAGTGEDRRLLLNIKTRPKRLLLKKEGGEGVSKSPE